MVYGRRYGLIGRNGIGKTTLLRTLATWVNSVVYCSCFVGICRHVFFGLLFTLVIFRSYVRPQKVFPIPMKFGMQVEVDEWCTTVCRMTRSKVKVTRPLKLEILQFSKSISSAISNVSWQMTTDSETMEQYLTFVWSRFLISVLVFVSHHFELGRFSVSLQMLLLLQ